MLKKSERDLPSLEYLNAQMRSPSVVAIVPWNGNSTPCSWPTDSTRPIVRATALGGSSSRPNVSARWNISSESVVPSISG